MNPYGQRNGGGWCECGECQRRFGGLTGFDAHRMDVNKNPYDWRCATDAELASKGYEQDARGTWKDRRNPRFGQEGDTESYREAASG